MSFNAWMPGYSQPFGYTPAWQPQRPDMGQGYPQMQQTAPAQPQSQPQGFFVRPVTNREEAVAAQIDFLSPGTFMPDFTNGRVYFKRFNSNTGSCDFMTFRLEQSQQAEEPQQPTAPEFATKADLVEMQQVIQGLAADIDSIRGRGGKRIADE